MNVGRVADNKIGLDVWGIQQVIASADPGMSQILGLDLVHTMFEQNFCNQVYDYMQRCVRRVRKPLAIADKPLTAYAI